MKIVIGVNNGPQSQDALALGSVIAQSLNASITVANVYPVAYDYPSQAHVDAEWRAFLVEQAHEILADVKDELSDVANVEYHVHPHRSSGVGLAEIAAESNADMIVIGSAPGGSEDRIHGGSTSDQLLHGSPVPVAIAPHGYRSWVPPQLDRVVVAYQRTSESDHCLKYTVRGLQRAGVDVARHLHLVTLMQALPRRFRNRMDDAEKSDMLIKLEGQASETLAMGSQQIDELLGTPAVVPTSTLGAEDVVRALSRFDWHDGDVLVVGSTGAGPVRRVFLGDMTYKLIRAATVPVVVVPSSAGGRA